MWLEQRIRLGGERQEGVALEGMGGGWNGGWDKKLGSFESTPIMPVAQRIQLFYVYMSRFLTHETVRPLL